MFGAASASAEQLLGCSENFAAIKSVRAPYRL